MSTKIIDLEGLNRYKEKQNEEIQEILQQQGGSSVDYMFRKSNTLYNVGDIAFLSSLPTGWFLECESSGTTNASLTIANPSIDAEVVDGTVTWKIKKIEGSNNTYYGSCSTAASTQTKAVTISGFELKTGAQVAVKFTVTNTASNPQLNVNSTGAKYIYYRGSYITASYLAANSTYLFIYNGTQYELIGDIDTDTQNTSASNLTSGTLSVARGGTGKNTLTSGSVLVGNGTSAVTFKAIDTTSGGTSGSTSLITSGAVYSGLYSKAAKSTTLAGYGITNAYTKSEVDNKIAESGGSSGGGDRLPVGTIIPYGGNTTPTGYLECNGAAVSRTMYPDLFTAIGTIYGAGDGSTTFNLPNYKFISDNEAHVFGNGKNLAFSDGSILFGPRTSSSSAMSYTTQAYGKSIGAAQTSGTGLTSGKIAGVATKDLLGNTPENSGLIADLPTSTDTIYIIKAFDGQTPDSALIDITQYAQALANAQVPTGMILPCATDNPQTGYLLCDGSQVSRTTYKALFNAIGTKYGAGDGSTTFNLPSIIDKTIWGGSTAGTVLSAGLPNISGSMEAFYGVSESVMSSSGALSYTLRDSPKNFGSSSSKNYTLGFNASRSSSIYGNSTTVQPPALTMRYMIKY